MKEKRVCEKCGEPHYAKGLCKNCYQREYYQRPEIKEDTDINQVDMPRNTQRSYAGYTITELKKIRSRYSPGTRSYQRLSSVIQRKRDRRRYSSSFWGTLFR